MASCIARSQEWPSETSAASDRWPCSLRALLKFPSLAAAMMSSSQPSTTYATTQRASTMVIGASHDSVRRQEELSADNSVNVQSSSPHPGTHAAFVLAEEAGWKTIRPFTVASCPGHIRLCPRVRSRFTYVSKPCGHHCSERQLRRRRQSEAVGRSLTVSLTSTLPSSWEASGKWETLKELSLQSF